MLSRELTDRLYNATGAIADRAEILARFVEESVKYRATHPGVLDIRYGDSSEESLDIFLPSEKVDRAPVHIFIHGGSWFQFGSREWSFIAKPLTVAGAIVVIPRYSPCPEACIGEIVAQMRATLYWVWRNIERYGGDRDRIFLSGHSVGGHLALEVLLTNWHEEYGLPDDVIKGATLISGIYDLHRIAYSYVEDYASLSPRESHGLNPLGKLRRVTPPLVLTIGSLEPEEFIIQLREFAQAWVSAGNIAETIVVEGVNHLTTFAALSRGGGVIVRAILQQMALRHPMLTDELSS